MKIESVDILMQVFLKQRSNMEGEWDDRRWAVKYGSFDFVPRSTADDELGDDVSQESQAESQENPESVFLQERTQRRAVRRLSQLFV